MQFLFIYQKMHYIGDKYQLVVANSCLPTPVHKLANFKSTIDARQIFIYNTVIS